MLYSIQNITHAKLMALIRQGKLLGVTQGELDDSYDPPAPSIGVDITQALQERGEQSYQQLVQELNQATAPLPPLPPNFVRPYTRTLAEATLLSEPDDEPLLNIIEAHHWAAGLLDTLMAALKHAGIDASWQLELELTNHMLQFQHNGCKCTVCSGQLGPDPWPIQGHLRTCTCKMCATLRELYFELDEARRMDEMGWVGHMVTSDSESPTSYNAHTHLHARLGHPDFQIVLPVPAAFAEMILGELAERVKRGEKFQPGSVAKDLWEHEGMHFDVGFVQATEAGRQVLRVIIPDEHGNLTLEAMRTAGATEAYLMQFDTTDYSNLGNPAQA